MPLNIVTLTEEILKLTDKSRPDFIGFPPVVMLPGPGGGIDFPATNVKVAANWAKVAARYFAELVVPLVLPDGHTLATTAFKEAMAPALFPPGTLTGIVALTNGFIAYAATISLPTSLSPTPPQIATPPPAPFIIPPLPPAPIAAVPAGIIAAIIDVWARTGMVSISGGSPVVWS